MCALLQKIMTLCWQSHQISEISVHHQNEILKTVKIIISIKINAIEFIFKTKHGFNLCSYIVHPRLKWKRFPGLSSVNVRTIARISCVPCRRSNKFSMLVINFGKSNILDHFLHQINIKNIFVSSVKRLWYMSYLGLPFPIIQ